MIDVTTSDWINYNMTKKKYFNLLLFVFAAMLSCTTTTEDVNELTAQEIIDKAIGKVGGDDISNSVIEFDFRGRHYRSIRNGGTFQYERIFKDSINTVRDVLNNVGFERYINDTVSSTTPDSMKVKYSNSVNSVLYFALLPYGLNDPAVRKEKLQESTISNKKYYKIKITFQKEGGGVDYEDVFIYWIEKEHFTVDYFGYTYITDGGGARFRSAYNQRTIEGIRFSDYINFKPKKNRLDVENFDVALQNDALKELSTIEIENISVK